LEPACIQDAISQQWVIYSKREGGQLLVTITHTNPPPAPDVLLLAQATETDVTRPNSHQVH
jgi:hypothetical protein